MNIKTTIPALTAAVTLAFTALAFTQGAHADDIDGIPTKKVSYSDLNLDTSAGAKTLLARIQSAARNVCSNFDGKDLTQHQLWNACYNHAVDAAVVKVNSSAVAAIRSQSTGQAPAG